MATYSWNFTATCTVPPVDTPTLHSDWLNAAPPSLVVGYLLPLSQPSVFISPHIVKPPMGTFFLLPDHLSLFSLLLGGKGERKSRREQRGIYKG